MRFSSSRVSMRSVFLTCDFYRLSRSSASIYQGLSVLENPRKQLGTSETGYAFFNIKNKNTVETISKTHWKTYTSRCPFFMGTHQESQHPLLVHLLRAVLYSALSRQFNMETQRKGQRKQQNNSERGGTCRRRTNETKKLM